jgi:hypothetical protein
LSLIELTGFGDLLRAVGILYWMLIIGALVAAVKLPKTRNGKVTAVLAVLGLFATYPVRWAWDEEQKRETARTVEAMFQERCKKAGEFLHRTVDNVEGVLLLKIREQTSRGDQYKMDDPYGHDSAGNEYLKGFFLEPMLEANKYANAEAIERIRRDYRGYRYVDAIDPNDGKRYRYTVGMKVVGKMDAGAPNVQVELKRNPNYDLNIYRYVLDRTRAPDPSPLYGVTYDDISTREERDHWIAGSSLKVIDLKTNEVIAERIGYMMDRGQGNTSGGRAPWLMAASSACPRFGPNDARQPGFSYQVDQTRRFVTKVLNPIPEK